MHRHMDLFSIVETCAADTAHKKDRSARATAAEGDYGWDGRSAGLGGSRLLPSSGGDGILSSGWCDKRFDDLDVRAAGVLATLLRLYAETGRPPSLDKIAAAAGIQASEADLLLVELYHHDLAIRGEGGQTIGGAYPFTEAVAGHTVTYVRAGHSLNTMCVIDALGAGAMCRENTVVRSACHGCGAPVVAQIKDSGASLTDVRPRETVVCRPNQVPKCNGHWPPWSSAGT